MLVARLDESRRGWWASARVRNPSSWLLTLFKHILWSTMGGSLLWCGLLHNYCVQEVGDSLPTHIVNHGFLPSEKLQEWVSTYVHLTHYVICIPTFRGPSPRTMHPPKSDNLFTKGIHHLLGLSRGCDTGDPFKSCFACHMGCPL